MRTKQHEAEALLFTTLTEFWESTPRPTPAAFIARFRGCILAIPHSDAMCPPRLLGRRNTKEEQRRYLAPPRQDTPE